MTFYTFIAGFGLFDEKKIQYHRSYHLRGNMYEFKLKTFTERE